MRHLMTLVSAGAAVVGAACLAAGADDRVVRTYRGTSVKVGHGTAQAYITMEGDTPVELGVALSAAALHGLPAGDGSISHTHGVSFFEHLLELPANNPTPFRFVELDWNPGGHEPPGIYDSPHFDFHFYTVGVETRNEIVPENPMYQTRGTRLPAPQFIPDRYIAPGPTIVPRMGVHWVDTQAPELNGSPFTSTFIYGSWDGRLIFFEPMVTKAFIERTRDTTIAVPVAARFHQAGAYPTSYRVRFDQASGEYRIALTGFAMRAAGATP